MAEVVALGIGNAQAAALLSGSLDLPDVVIAVKIAVEKPLDATLSGIPNVPRWWFWYMMVNSTVTIDL